VFRQVSGLGIAVAVAVSLAAQSSPPVQQSQPAPKTAAGQPVFRTEANYIRVDAFVTRDGAPVPDLTAADFEVLEDGAPQKVDTFEFVRIQPAGPQVTRIEPSSQQAANQMAADPRARVFVLFLDVDHVPIEGSHRVRVELTRMIDRMVSPDDFIGIITSRHSPTELILGRKTALIAEQLEKYWYWGNRDTSSYSEDEHAYLTCFSGFEGGEAVAYEMIDRRREKLTLDALSDLVVYLRGIREERKAVLALTAGWGLYRENPSLARPLYIKGIPRDQQKPRMPNPPPIGVGPGGKPILGDDPRYVQPETLCERHRWELAHTDNWQDFQAMLRDANRSNVSFYPIDPRGLVVFDSPIGPRRPPSVTADREMLRLRQDHMRWMADETDGLTVMDQNNLEPGLRRIADDLSMYYLLGYYSSNPELDGKYRKITVRVKRPGLKVRHRRGYRAATREEVTAAEKAVEEAEASAPAVSDAVTRALGRLALLRPEAALFVHATQGVDGRLWVSGELSRAAAKAPGWAQGGRVSLMALDASGNTVGMMRKELPSGTRDFMSQLPLDAGGAAITRVMVRAEPKDGAPVGVEVEPAAGEPLLFRQMTAAGEPGPAADFRFYRTETLIFRWPVAAGDRPESARVLDRAGKPMPLQTTPSIDRTGPWMTGSIRLAPLVEGDYVLELVRSGDGGSVRTVVPFRVVR
jgi:VWFA-related protein